MGVAKTQKAQRYF